MEEEKNEKKKYYCEKCGEIVESEECPEHCGKPMKEKGKEGNSGCCCCH